MQKTKKDYHKVDANFVCIKKYMIKKLTYIYKPTLSFLFKRKNISVVNK